MKKLLIIVLCLCLLFVFGCSSKTEVSTLDYEVETTETIILTDETTEETPIELSIPSSSYVFDKTFALKLLELCTGHEKDKSYSLMVRAGFNVVKQAHFEKSTTDSSHTSAYTIGVKKSIVNGEERNVVLVTIRGTNGGEWLSNIDFAPSRTSDTIYAENFLKAAEDVKTGLETVIKTIDNPVVIVSGHSRGASTANLLGVLLDKEMNNDDVYVYTFATPTTIRNTEDIVCNNIFNVINTADVVTKVPLESMGYKRAGIDLVGSSTTENDLFISSSLDVVNNMCTTIEGFYNERHNLYGSGLSKDGVSIYQFMVYLLSISSYVTGGGSLSESAIATVSPQSDLYPLVELMAYSLSNNMVEPVLAQHMPQVYAQIISELDL